MNALRKPSRALHGRGFSNVVHHSAAGSSCFLTAAIIIPEEMLYHNLYHI